MGQIAGSAARIASAGSWQRFGPRRLPGKGQHQPQYAREGPGVNSLVHLGAGQCRLNVLARNHEVDRMTALQPEAFSDRLRLTAILCAKQISRPAFENTIQAHSIKESHHPFYSSLQLAVLWPARSVLTWRRGWPFSKVLVISPIQRFIACFMNCCGWTYRVRCLPKRGVKCAGPARTLSELGRVFAPGVAAGHASFTGTSVGEKAGSSSPS